MPLQLSLRVWTTLALSKQEETCTMNSHSLGSPHMGSDEHNETHSETRRKKTQTQIGLRTDREAYIKSQLQQLIQMWAHTLGGTVTQIRHRLKSLTGEVSNSDHLVTVKCSALRGSFIHVMKQPTTHLMVKALPKQHSVSHHPARSAQ